MGLRMVAGTGAHALAHTPTCCSLSPRSRGIHGGGCMVHAWVVDMGMTMHTLLRYAWSICYGVGGWVYQTMGWCRVGTLSISSVRIHMVTSMPPSPW
jgi:hypothetical protein